MSDSDEIRCGSDRKRPDLQVGLTLLGLPCPGVLPCPDTGQGMNKNFALSCNRAGHDRAGQQGRTGQGRAGHDLRALEILHVFFVLN